MAGLVVVDELVEGNVGARRPLWVNADHVVYFGPAEGGATELTLTTGEKLRIAGDPKSLAPKLGLDRVLHRRIDLRQGAGEEAVRHAVILVLVEVGGSGHQ